MLDPGMRFDYLQLVLRQLDVPPPRELAARISTLPKAGTLPDPGTTWLFISSVLYRARQRWARKQLHKHLPTFFVGKGDPVPLREGEPIPGMPDWQLAAVFDNSGAIVHRGTREYISGLTRHHWQHGEDQIFPHDIPAMVPSHSPWDIPGRLAAAIHGDEMQTAVDNLVTARILLETDFYGLAWEDRGDPDAHRLSRRAHAISRDVLRFRRLWVDPANHLWLTAAIGDWPTAHELAHSHDNSEVGRAVAEKFEAYRQRRLAIAHFNLSLDPDSVGDLKVLYQEGADDFAACVNQSIATLGASPILAEVLVETGDLQWNQCVFATFERVFVDPTSYLPFELFRLATPLLERGYRADDVLAALVRYDQHLDRMAMIFLKHAPAQSLPVIRRALRHEHVTLRSAEEVAAYGPPLCPDDRRRTAVILSVIDRPWSAEELISAIGDLWEERHDPTEIVSVIVALCESAEPTTRAAGEQWLARIGNYEHLEREVSRFQEDWHALYEEAIALRGVSVLTESSVRPGDAPTDS